MPSRSLRPSPRPAKAWMYRPPRPFTSGITTVLTLKEQGMRDSRPSTLIAKVPNAREQFKASPNYRRNLQKARDLNNPLCLCGPTARKSIALRALGATGEPQAYGTDRRQPWPDDAARLTSRSDSTRMIRCGNEIGRSYRCRTVSSVD